MPKEYSRTVRVAEQIHRELPELIRGIKDPRVGMVTVVDVEVTRDFSHAKIYFSVLGSDDEATDSTVGLKHAAAYLRRELGRRMRLRVVPELHFVYDETQKIGERISTLIDEGLAAHTHSSDDSADSAD